MINYKKQTKIIFKENKTVVCPAFPGEKIVFNSKGMSHLFYKGANKLSTRPEKEISVRISLLPRALLILQKATFFQEECKLKSKEGKVFYYWAFEAVVDDRRIKVIVRQVGKGQKHFWSVIPAWRRIHGEVFNAKSKLNIH